VTRVAPQAFLWNEPLPCGLPKGSLWEGLRTLGYWPHRDSNPIKTTLAMVRENFSERLFMAET